MKYHLMPNQIYIIAFIENNSYLWKYKSSCTNLNIYVTSLLAKFKIMYLVYGHHEDISGDLYKYICKHDW